MAIDRVNAVLVEASDFERSVAFYRLLFGDRLRVDDHGGGPHAECELGPVHFAVFPGGPAARDRGGLRFALHCDDVVAEHERLVELGVEFDQPPTVMPFGGVLARLRDPDGNGVDLMTWRSELDDDAADGG